MTSKEIWIAWHVSQRSRNLSKDLGLAIFEKVIENNAVSRHFLSSLWTIYILLKVRPEKIFLQYSFLLLVVIAAYKKLAPYPVYIICDCHTKALRRSVKGRVGRAFWWVKEKSFQSVNTGIVSNVEMVPDIEKLTKNYCVLPDKIPNIKSFASRSIKKSYCVFVSSYAVDEPLDSVISVAERLDGVIAIYCTGKIPDNLKKLKETPYKNIIFTDFLTQQEYYNLLANADCILALTNEEGCLQCAGYEALSVEVPMVLSNTTALKTYFEDAAIYSNHSAQELACGIQEALSNAQQLLFNMAQIKSVRENEYSAALHNLQIRYKHL